ncbi:hypothetical protein [Streptomyces sp. NPDC094032]|uniref:hypothetical protein n=1 Tax=Streptomyces sp. NPDC094032 TaxID=3155308 RepID=UPI003326A44D
MSWPSVVLIARARECAAIEAEIRSLGVGKHPLGVGEFLHWNGNSYALDFSGDVLADFAPEEIEDAARRIGEPPRVIYVSCQSMDAARIFLSFVLPRFTGLIDTNHGDVVEFAEFVDLIEKHPRWDWRLTEVADLLQGQGDDA